MPSNTHTESLRSGALIRHGSVALLPIEHVVLQACPINGRVWFSAIKKPYALVVRDAGRIWAIDSDAAAVSLERLCQIVPGLDSVLALM